MPALTGPTWPGRRSATYEWDPREAAEYDDRVQEAAKRRMEPLPNERETGKIRQMWQMNGITAHIDSSGRLVIPAVIRRSLGLNPGAAVTLRVADGELRVVARSEAVRLAQERVRRHVPAGRKLSAELIAERKAEWNRG